MMWHILYLASGNSRRFGSNKLLTPVLGKPMVCHGLDILCGLVEKRRDCTLTVVSRYTEIQQIARQRGVPAVDSPESEHGISYTIRAGLDALRSIDPEDFVVFVVADQPYLTEATVERLLDVAQEGVDAAMVSWGGRTGNPTMFSARLIPELRALQGDQGGRIVLNRYRATCRIVAADDERELMDIDRKNDLPERFL